MPVDVFDHMEEAWKLERNPFQRKPSDPECRAALSPECSPRNKRLPKKTHSRRGPRRTSDRFLWSQGVRADTGFGKTTLMQEITREITATSAHQLWESGAKKHPSCPSLLHFLT